MSQPAGPTSAPSAPAPAATTILEERPPEGLARGRWAAPRWAIAALGVAVVVMALAFLLARARSTRRRAPGPKRS